MTRPNPTWQLTRQRKTNRRRTTSRTNKTPKGRRRERQGQHRSSRPQSNYFRSCNANNSSNNRGSPECRDLKAFPCPPTCPSLPTRTLLNRSRKHYTKLLSDNG